MKSQTLARAAFAFMSLALAAGVNPATAQTSLGWGQHVSPYGSGYVGNVPNSVPVTSYYRAPGMGLGHHGLFHHGQAATTMYAPAAGVPVTAGYAPATAYAQSTGYSPALSYRVGTANAAPYTAAYSPVVTPTTPYNANWQYPPQTTMPTVAQPVVANYAPMPPAYTTNYARTPVTMYRPVTAMSPIGVQQTVMQPCAGYEYQPRRQHCCGFFSWLFCHHHRTPPVVPTPVAPVTVSYPCPAPVTAPCPMPTTCASPAPVACPTPSPCATGACPTPGTAAPYYTPGPAGTTVPSTTVPANTVPSLGGSASFPSTGSSATTIAPPGSVNLAPGSVVPGSLNSSGAQRLDYAPPAESYTPNVSPLVPLSPLAPVDTNGDGVADEVPSLNSPSNAPIGSGLREEYRAPPQNGGHSSARPQYNVQTQQPQAVIRRDSSITPIPDPEYPSGTRAKVNKAPKLISPRDKTAVQAISSDARLASFEKELPPPPQFPRTAPAPASSKVLGDDIWRSGK